MTEITLTVDGVEKTLEVEPRRLLADVSRQAFVYDAEGQPLTSSFADYLLPGATVVPDSGVHHIVTPSRLMPLGIKGMGEGGAIGPPAAIANAIAWPQQRAYGTDDEMDLPERDWSGLAAALGRGVGARAETVAEIGEAVGAALASNKPAIVHIPVRSVLSPYMDSVTR